MSSIVDGYQRGDAATIGYRMEQLLAQGQQVTLQISGDSMRPTLKPRRDAAVLAPLDIWPPKRHDIVFFKSERSPSGYALHRVRRIKADGLIMNGDAQAWTEGPIPKDRVLAKAILLMRNQNPVNVDGIGYRGYVWCWSLTLPIRWPLFAIWRGIKQLLGKE